MGGKANGSPPAFDLLAQRLHAGLQFTESNHEFGKPGTPGGCRGQGKPDNLLCRGDIGIQQGNHLCNLVADRGRQGQRLKLRNRGLEAGDVIGKVRSHALAIFGRPVRPGHNRKQHIRPQGIMHHVCLLLVQHRRRCGDRAFQPGIAAFQADIGQRGDQQQNGHRDDADGKQAGSDRQVQAHGTIKAEGFQRSFPRER